METNGADPHYGTAHIETAADPASWELWPAPDHPEVLYQHFPEFTCLCPRSGYPDFATIHLIVIPKAKVVELKHLKLWLNSYRDRRISHEVATTAVLQTLTERIAPHLAVVLMEYTPRGNLTTLPLVEHRSDAALTSEPSSPLGLAIANADLVKARLIDRVLARTMR